MRKSLYMTATQAQADRQRSMGFEIYDVPFFEELAGPQGMQFWLLKEPGTSMRRLQRAAAGLRRKRDVVGAITYIEVEDDPDL